jgi:hypothetical protein
MKKLLFGLIVLVSGCSHSQNDISLIKDNIEQQIHRVDSAQKTLFVKTIDKSDESTNSKINKLEFLKDCLTKELNKIKPKITNDWYKSRNLPIDKILRELDKQNLNLTDYEILKTSAHDIVLRIDFGVYNMETMNKVKIAVTKVLSFEPKETDKYGSLLWTTSYGSIEVYESGGNSLIFQFLSLEKNK